MRIALALMMISALSLTAFAEGETTEALPRNPFWPQGYEGKRFPITTAPRIKSEVNPELRRRSATTAAMQREERANQIATEQKKASEEARKAEEALWNAAEKALSFGSKMNFNLNGKNHTTICIDGKFYAAGDVISRNNKNRRFTWVIESISANNRIKLRRIRNIELNKELTKGNQ